MPEVATGGVLRKKVFFKMSQNSEEIPGDRGDICDLCKIFKNTFFTEQLRTIASEMQILLQ